MSKILIWPNPIFTEPSETIFDEAKLQVITWNMGVALSKVNDERVTAVGLSAVQIGVLSKVIAAKDGDKFRFFINSRVVETEGADTFGVEGCLSVPETFLLTKRKEKIKVAYQEFLNGKLGEVKEEWFEGQLAKILQHEIDHTEGKMFTQVLNEKERRELFIKMTQYKKRRK